MGVVCGVGFMGAPVIEIEKLVGGEETMLAYQRLQQLMASGVMNEGEGKKGNQSVNVLESKCDYFDGTSFPIYLASPEDLENISLENIPLVRNIFHVTSSTSHSCHRKKIMCITGLTCLSPSLLPLP